MGSRADVAIDSAHDAEGTMKDNLAASLIIAVGLGVAIGYLVAEVASKPLPAACQNASREGDQNKRNRSNLPHGGA